MSRGSCSWASAFTGSKRPTGAWIDLLSVEGDVRCLRARFKSEGIYRLSGEQKLIDDYISEVATGMRLKMNDCP